MLIVITGREADVPDHPVAAVIRGPSHARDRDRGPVLGHLRAVLVESVAARMMLLPISSRGIRKMLRKRNKKSNTV